MPDRRLNPADIRAQIETLRVTHPDVCDDDELFALALESETDLPEFMAGIVARIADANGMVGKQDAMIKDLADRRNHYRARHEALREFAFKVLQVTGVNKLELTQATLNIRMGQSKVIITDERMLPDYAVRIKREPDKIAIKDRLMRGDGVPGASLSNAEPVLAITGIRRSI